MVSLYYRYDLRIRLIESSFFVLSENNYFCSKAFKKIKMGAKEFMTNEIEKLNNLISKGIDQEANVQLKKELSELVHLLDISHRYQISKNTIDTIFVLPDSNTGYSDYRIINDCESDNPAQWAELKINDEDVRLSEGDVIIRKK